MSPETKPQKQLTHTNVSHTLRQGYKCAQGEISSKRIIKNSELLGLDISYNIMYVKFI